MEAEIGTTQNLLSLISVVEHQGFELKTRRNIATVVYEVIRQITSEQKAIFLL
jgi:hypothetical protein